jgi:hypothetical protein
MFTLSLVMASTPPPNVFYSPETDRHRFFLMMVPADERVPPGRTLRSGLLKNTIVPMPLVIRGVLLEH